MSGDVRRRSGTTRRSNSTRPRRSARTSGCAGSGDCSSASSSSKTRSAEATPDCSRFDIDATWVSGWLNWREYWMNACTSPSDMLPGRHPEPADHGDEDVVEVPDEHDRRHDDAGEELRAEARLGTARRCGPRNCSSASDWWPKTLTSACPVYVSSMCALSCAGDAPLLDEQRLRPLGDGARHERSTAAPRPAPRARAAARSRASSARTPTSGQQRVEQLAHRLLHRLLDVVDVVGDPAEQLAARLACRSSAAAGGAACPRRRRAAAGPCAARRR